MKLNNFYPRSPCGERPIAGRITPNGTKFLSTLSLRRATAINGRNPDIEGISIHALLAESDHPKTSDHPHNTKFLSTLSLRRATVDAELAADEFDISIHALLAESDAG